MCRKYAAPTRSSITSAPEPPVALKTAAEDGRLRDLSGMGARSEEKILKALEAGMGDQPEPRRLLGQGLPAVRRVLAELEAHPAATAVSEAGSVRRRHETVRDLDLIATSSDAPALIGAFCDGDWVAEVVARGDTKATVVGHDGLRFDLRVVPDECYGNVLQHFTGSKDHNIALREEAQRRGLSISEYGVTTVETGEVVTHASEDALYAYLGYATPPAELREGTAEVAAARDGTLPALVELGDLRGEMCKILEQMGVPVEVHHHEVATAGQCEIGVGRLGRQRLGFGRHQLGAIGVAHHQRHADRHADDIVAGRSHIEATGIDADRRIRAPIALGDRDPAFRAGRRRRRDACFGDRGQPQRRRVRPRRRRRERQDGVLRCRRAADRA